MTVSTLTVVPEASASGAAPAAEPTTFLPRHPPAALAATSGCRCSSPTAGCAATAPCPAPPRRGRWTPAGSPNCPRTAPGTTAPPRPQYVARLRRYRDEIGHLAWAAPQDWMCEPLDPRQDRPDRRRASAPHRRQLPAAARPRPGPADHPGACRAGHAGDYLRCVDLYAAAGVDLTAAAAGRRRARSAAARPPPKSADILTALHRPGVTPAARVRLQNPRPRPLRPPAHLGRLDGLEPRNARRKPPLPGCTGHTQLRQLPALRPALARTAVVTTIATRGRRKPALFDRR